VRQSQTARSRRKFQTLALTENGHKKAVSSLLKTKPLFIISTDTAPKSAALI
jgi:hypothetical protein